MLNSFTSSAHLTPSHTRSPSYSLLLVHDYQAEWWGMLFTKLCSWLCRKLMHVQSPARLWVNRQVLALGTKTATCPNQSFASASEWSLDWLIDELTDWMIDWFFWTGIGDWKKNNDRTKTATEGNYVFITCEDQLPEYYGPTTFKWYTIEGEDDLQEVVEDERVFIDAVGKLFVCFLPQTKELLCKMSRDTFFWHGCVYVCATYVSVASCISKSGMMWSLQYLKFWYPCWRMLPSH